MHVFVTGASGGIGSVVVSELISAGHHVVGLARSDASAEIVRGLGAEVLRGNLDDVDVLKRGANDADGVIQLAFSNDFSDIEAGMATESRAVAALGAALERTGKPLVLAGGTPAIPGRASTEDDPFVTEGLVGGRGRTAQSVIAMAERGVRSSVVRLPRSVHTAGGPCGFASLLIEAARRTGISGYVGDGTQRWPAVHRLDAATLFRLALEDAPAGAVLHAVADEGDSMRSLADVIGHQLGVPVEPVAAESFGVLGIIFANDQPSSSTLTRERFGWRPTHPSLLDDLAAGNYPQLHL
jgi:nucleoside-diphosphate-sugar epimerase